jgi:hypothetical protein
MAASAELRTRSRKVGEACNEQAHATEGEAGVQVVMSMQSLAEVLGWCVIIISAFTTLALAMTYLGNDLLDSPDFPVII